MNLELQAKYVECLEKFLEEGDSSCCFDAWIAYETEQPPEFLITCERCKSFLGLPPINERKMCCPCNQLGEIRAVICSRVAIQKWKRGEHKWQKEEHETG